MSLGEMTAQKGTPPPSPYLALLLLHHHHLAVLVVQLGFDGFGVVGGGLAGQGVGELQEHQLLLGRQAQPLQQLSC